LRYSTASGAFADVVVPTQYFSLGSPQGLDFDADGNLYVAAGQDNKVLRFAPASQAVFNVTLNAASATPVTIVYSTANGTAAAGDDYTAAAGTITFAPGQTVRTILVRTLDDTLSEGDESFVVNLSSPSIGAIVVDGQGVATIQDNDAPPTKFYVVNDATTNVTYEYSANGSALENYSLNSGNAAPRGAASTAAGNKVWVVDANRKVFVYDAAGGLLGSWTAGSLASNASVQGIATNGTDVWIVDAKSDKVFKYAGAASLMSGSQIATGSFSLNSGNRDPSDIVTDGTHFWVTNNSSTDKVFKYTLTGALVGSWTISGGGGTPTGITIDPSADPTKPSTIWIVDATADRVYQYNGATSLSSGSATASTSFALAAGNTNPQGIADPPVSAAEPTAAATDAALLSMADEEGDSAEALAAAAHIPQGNMARQHDSALLSLAAEFEQFAARPKRRALAVTLS
jgi:hypothetical protein